MNAVDGKLIKLITNDVAGIVWFSSVGLIDKSAPFFTLDYLTNGLLIENIKQYPNRESTEKSLFFTKSFSNDFFICHIYGQSKSIEQDTRETMTLIRKNELASKKIIIIEEKGLSFSKALKKNYPEIQFINFEV